MKASRFAGIGGHHAPIGKTDDWITPRPIIEALGGAGSFDLDPCASVTQPWPTAQTQLTVNENGLLRQWFGRVWLNPPYSDAEPWLARLREHGDGVALIFARTETSAFFRHVWQAATAVLFLQGRLTFHQPDGSPGKGNSGAPSVLCAYGFSEADRLAAAPLDGAFVMLAAPRHVVALALEQTWLDAVKDQLRGRGPVQLADLYRAFAKHPKTARNPNWRAKLRQVLQQGPFERLDRGTWRAQQLALEGL